MNSVTLYSNGTAVICREYPVDDHNHLKVTIPVRKTDLDDVVSSLSVFGDVTITSPPTYIPTNAYETELSLDPSMALQELATKLAGAAVEIEAGSKYVGRLVGLHKYRREVDGAVIEQNRIVVLTDRGIQQIEESAIAALRFTDVLVQSEITKALEARLNRIKPDSSLIEFTVQPISNATIALVTYATPVAAWKIRYQLRMSPTDNEFEGQAIVDNDTDDDWIETLVTVVTGEPITFSTDLAEIRRPGRDHVNLVAARATGAVVAEEVIGEFMENEIMMAAPAGGGSIGPLLRKRSASELSPKAAQPQAEVRESGDYSIFTSPHPVNIGAKRSAIIPLFRIAVSEAPMVLFYRATDDPQRPFRAIRLTNSAAHSLSRGVCEVFNEGDFQGKCVLEPTRSGAEVLLIYAKETGVRVSKESGKTETRRIAINISEGAAYCEERLRQETVYRIVNNHATAFLFEIEHLRTWSDSEIKAMASAGDCHLADITNGKRLRVSLEAKGDLRVTVTEVLIVKTTFELTSRWLQTDIVETTNPLSPPNEVLECVEIQKQIDGWQRQLTEKVLETKTIEEEQKRLMKLIPNAHQDQGNEWRSDLAKSERELRDLQRIVIPKLNSDMHDARKRLKESLLRLRFSWTDK
jgi:hypothetical protein